VTLESGVLSLAAQRARCMEIQDLRTCVRLGNFLEWGRWNFLTPAFHQDLDILTFPPEGMTREQIKQSIHDSSRSFYLERSAKPQETYKILYYRFDEIKGPRGFFLGNKCKVDILVPGIMHLPALSPTHIQKLGGLPLLPFSVLMLQKLQAWDDHRNLRWTEPKKYAKSAIDARDLQHLLTLTDHVVPLRVSKPWRDLVLFGEEFQNLSFRRARDFCSLFPECKHDFELLGLLH
jgi:hypothetical protein